MWVRTIMAAAISVGFAGAAFAETYTCKIKESGSSGWIPTDVIVKLDPSSQTVMVNDSNIQYYFGRPVAGALKSKNGKRVLFSYTMSGIKNGSGQYTPGITYSLNIQLPSGKASLTGKPQGYANSWRGDGACRAS